MIPDRLPGAAIIRAAAVSLAFASCLLALFFALLPAFDAPLSFALYDRDGQLLGASVSTDGQWRFPAGTVSDKVSKALITFEDKRFFVHPGVDPLALARACAQNITERRVVSGGSTLTMQTVRLARGNPPRTIAQKAREAFLALLLELRYTKRQILSLYAANAPYGGNVVGLEAASWRYFNRSSSNLTWAEAATLAVLPNQPSLVHPAGDRELLLLKRNSLLRELCARGNLGEKELELSLDERLPEKPYPLPRLAPHYLERMKKEIGEQKNSTHTATHSASQRSTIDRSLQISLTNTLERWSAQFSASGIRNACAVILDTKTGEILAYVGNTGAGREDGQNTDVDIILARRSSGSVLKPFLYAGMLDAGLILPHQLVVDIPTRIGSYKPENNLPVYQGVVSADEALSRSLNIPAIRSLQEYGVAPFLNLLKNFGFTTMDRTADEYGLPLILGGGEVTLDETTRAYASLMNRAADKGEVTMGKTKVAAGENGVPAVLKGDAVSVGAAWLTLDALLQGTRPSEEALWQSFASARKIAWKTGTSYGNRDAWAIGTTPRYTVGVWIGNATGEGRPELKSISTSAPVLFDIFSFLPRSDWIYAPEADLREVTVCADSGYLAGPDCTNTKRDFKPENAKDGEPCPYCRTVSLTPDGKYQATAKDLTGKWSGSLPLVERRFVLPPSYEYWYMKHSLSYTPLPPWLPASSGSASRPDLAIVFPEPGANVFIPVEIDGNPGSLIMEAAHRDPEAILYWDIDGEYLGETRVYHQLAARPEPGEHLLTVTDSRGNRATRKFTVLKE